MSENGKYLSQIGESNSNEGGGPGALIRPSNVETLMPVKQQIRKVSAKEKGCKSVRYFPIRGISITTGEIPISSR